MLKLIQIDSNKLRLGNGDETMAVARGAGEMAAPS